MIRFPVQHFLLERLVDYAGLFPPAALSLSDSLQRYASYQEGPACSVLGRFVCKVSQLQAVRACLTPGQRLPLSALLDSPQEVDQVEAFHAQVGASVRVELVETRWVDAEQGGLWLQRWKYPLFFEVRPDQWESAAELARQAGGRFGLKLRTGGLTAEGIPPVDDIVAFLEFLREVQLPYKFTAGLHHACGGHYPLTYEPGSATARMYGFAELFGLACLHWWGRLDAARLRDGLLAEAFRLQADESGLHYLGSTCSAPQVQEYRRRAGQSFGSCSFEEPVQELTHLGWIC